MAEVTLMPGGLAVGRSGSPADMPHDQVSNTVDDLLEAFTLLQAIVSEANNMAQNAEASDPTGRTSGPSRIVTLARVGIDTLDRAMTRLDPYA